MYNKKQCFIIFLIIAVVSAGLGFFLAETSCDKKVQNSENTFQAGWKAAEDRLKENGFLGCGAAGCGSAADMKHIHGEIQEIKSNKMYLRVKPIHPLDDPELNTRIAEISGNTEIYELTGEEKRAEGQPAGIQVLRDYKGEETKLSDVEPGRTVTVFAQEDTRKAKQFKAVKIIIWPARQGSLFVKPIK